MFHYFSELGRDTLVSATTFTYQTTSQACSTHSVYSFRTKSWRSGFQRAPQEAAAGNMYVTAQMPPVKFEHSEPVIQDQVQTLGGHSLEGFAGRFVTPQTRWIGLYGEGIPGLLSLDATWYCKRDLSPISQVLNKHTGATKPLFGLPCLPSRAEPIGAPFESAHLVNLQSDGRLSQLLSSDRARGIRMSDEGGGRSPFLPFQTTMNRLVYDSSVRQRELDKDGLSDVAPSYGSLWYQSLGEGGFGSQVP